jgi:adenylate cyclase
VIFFILLTGSIGAWMKGGGDFWEKFFDDIISYRVLRLFLTWYVIVIITIFALDVSEKYGAGILKKQLMGRYHTPLQEDRIFLFLDLKSSTEIAESIGDENYFRMLRDLYQAANEAIIGFNGEIYQYVGDEIVISWTRDQGLDQANCLQCFFAILDMIDKRSVSFRELYGVVPEYKAAIHSGQVTAGEVGIIKKDIVYSGDVLNSTARMMALCKQYKVNLIVSNEIREALVHTPGYTFTYLDNPILRGKSVHTKLFSVKREAQVRNETS